jgi:hypothetical protein
MTHKQHPLPIFHTRSTTAVPLWMRMSWVALWWGTAGVSVWGWQGISHELLAQAGVTDPHWAGALIGAGVGLDVVIGALLWGWSGRWVYALAAAGVLLLSLVATAMTPHAWLHPYGPLLKNLPLFASLVWAWQVDHLENHKHATAIAAAIPFSAHGSGLK